MTTTRSRADELVEPAWDETPAPVQASERSSRVFRALCCVLALAAAQSVVALDVDLPVVRPLLALFTMLGLPTLLLYRTAGLPSSSLATKALCAFGCSLLGLMAVGLLLNATLPLVGVDRPLQPVVLAATWFLLDAALLVWRPLPVSMPSSAAAVRRMFGARLRLIEALAVVSVVLAVLGAVRLNNGAGGEVALAAHLAAAAALLALMMRRDGTQERDVRILTLVATSLLLATSLRGWHITGHDIQAEFFAFTLTNDDGHWAMSALQNAYNACLSVNILPTVLAQATGLSGLVVFKVVLQLVFALVPALTFLLARRYLSRRMALAAAAFVLAFPTFFTDMPYLVRQEVAFVFLALMLLAGTEPVRPQRNARWLAGLFGIGVVLSHYSTTYLMLLGLVFGLAVLGATRLLSRWSGRVADATPRPLVLLHPAVVAFLAVASMLWAGPVTHTGGHAQDVARATISAILGKGTDIPGSSDLSYRLFSRDHVSPRERLDRFVDETLEARAGVPDSDLLVKVAGPAEQSPEIIPAGKVPLTPAGRALESLGVDPSQLNTVARLACAVLMQLFLMLGLVGVLSRGAVGARRKSVPGVPREAACVVLGTLAALGLVVLVPSLSVEYGVLRAFQQTLLVTAPVMAAGLWMLVRLFRVRVGVLSAAVPVGLLMVLCGAAPTLLGGNPARLALQNFGLYHDRYLATDADVLTMSWLAAAEHADDERPKVITSRNNGIRIALARGAPVAVADRMYPTLLTTGSYVFADSHLVRKRQSTIFYSGDLITYAYPLHNLDRHLDLVYSAGRSRVYR